jgi:hypothetical protein
MGNVHDPKPFDSKV